MKRILFIVLAISIASPAFAESGKVLRFTDHDLRQYGSSGRSEKKVKQNPGEKDVDKKKTTDTDAAPPAPDDTAKKVDGAPELAYILHRGDTKDPGPDQFLSFDPWGYEVWQLEGGMLSNQLDPSEMSASIRVRPAWPRRVVISTTPLAARVP